MRHVFLLLTFFLSSFAYASPVSFVFQGQIVKPNGSALEASNVDFRVGVLSTSNSCLLYEETFTLNMSNSEGVFNLSVGNGAATANGNFQNLKEALDNTLSTLTGLSCGNGTAYTPSLADTRRIRLTFDDGSGPVTLSQDHILESIPYAQHADELQGHVPEDFLKTNGSTAGVTQVNLEQVFDGGSNQAELLALIGGSSNQYSPISANGAGSLPSFTSASPPSAPSAGDIWLNSDTGDIIYYNGSTQQVVGANAGTVTSVAAGTGLSGGTITGSGTISLANQGVDTAQLANDAVTTAQILNGTITGDDIAANTIAAETKLTSSCTNNQILQSNGSGNFVCANLPTPPSAPVTSVYGRVGVVTAMSGDYAANQVVNTAAGSVAATNVQAAINELDTEKLALAGGTMTGAIAMGSQKITGLGAPTAGTDAVTKTYVDAQITASGSGTVTSVATGAGLSGGTITGSGTISLANQGVDTAQLANDAVTTAKILNGTITGDDIAANTIAAETKLTSSCTNNQILQSNGSGNFVCANLPTPPSAPVTSVYGRVGVVTAMSGDYSGNQIVNTAAGSVAATNVQAAINELDTEKLALAGGTMTGAIAMGSQKITGLGAPTAGTDAVTKTYVDAQVASAGDDLGDHEADQNLDLANNLLVGNGGTSGVAITSGGNVGIGTTSPSSKLEIDDIATSDATATSLTITGTATANLNAAETAGLLGSIDFYNRNAANLGVAARILTGRGDNVTGTGEMRFQTNPDGVDPLTRMTINKLGNVGIGTTAPSARLETIGVNGLPTASGFAEEAIHRLSAQGVVGALDLGMQTGTSSAWIQTRPNKLDYSVGLGSAKLLLNPIGGNVGIGTTSPTQKLDVNGNIKGTQLCIGTDCRSAWPGTGGGGTVTSVATGTGLSGGTITGSGTISLANQGVDTAQLANDAVTTAQIENATIINADIADNTIVATTKLTSSCTNNQILQSDGSGNFVCANLPTPPSVPVTSVYGRVGVVTAMSGDYAANQVVNTAAGSVAATNVQAAINELDTEKLALAGGTMTGDITMGSNTVTGLRAPTATSDAATKAYVDAAVGSASGGSTFTELVLMNPFVPGTQVSVAHGQGSQPKTVVWFLENIIAEGGYSPGNRVFSLTTSSSGGVGFSVISDDTNITASAAVVPRIWQKNANSNLTITAANWKLGAMIAHSGSGGGGSSTTSAIVAGFPEAIRCTKSPTEVYIFYIIQTNVSGNITYRRTTTSTVREITFSPSGAYLSHSGASTYDCVSAAKSISTLTSEGNAFYFGNDIGSVAQDDDNNTKIMVEKNPDEDKIRFDTAGSERMIIDEVGNVGIGTTSPAAKLDVAGEVKFGNTASTCNSTTEGQQRYNSTNKKMEFCNGTTWTVFASGSSGGRTSCPASFTLIGTSGELDAFCISTNEETSANWLTAVTSCSNKNPVARLCTSSEWALACVKGTPNNMTGNWEWVADLLGNSAHVMGNSGCNSFGDGGNVGSSHSSRCCFR